jgi:hypothetical protein
MLFAKPFVLLLLACMLDDDQPHMLAMTKKCNFRFDSNLFLGNDQPKVVSPKKSPSTSNRKTPSPSKKLSKSSPGSSSPEKADESVVSKPLTTFSEKLEQIIENEVTKTSIEDDSVSQPKSEGIESH